MCFLLIVLGLMSCKFSGKTYTYTDSKDTMSVIHEINTLDTASIRTGKPHYTAYSRKTNYYVNGVLVKHDEQHFPDSAISTNINENTPEDLQYTAFFDTNVRARKSAVSMLKDQSDIQHVAYFDSDVEIRKLAVTMLENEADLQHVAFFDNNVQVRLLAVTMLKEQDNIQHVAFFDQDTKVRKLAVSKLNRRTDIEHVATFDADNEVKIQALKQLSKK